MIEQSQCVNGCTDTKTEEGQPPVKVPRPAKRGLLCSPCARKFRSALEDIPALFAMLDLAVTPTRTGSGTGPGNFAESPVPISLGAAALRDTRGLAARAPGDELLSEGAPDVPNTFGVLHTWARDLRDELNPNPQPVMITAGQLDERCLGRVVTLWRMAVRVTVRDGWQTPAATILEGDYGVRFTVSPSAPVSLSVVRTVQSEARYLLGAFDRLLEQLWVDDAMREILAVRLALLTAHGMPPQRPVGRCYVQRPSGQECAGSVFEQPDGSLRCSRCREHWAGIGVVRYQAVTGKRVVETA